MLTKRPSLNPLVCVVLLPCCRGPNFVNGVVIIGSACEKNTKMEIKIRKFTADDNENSLMHAIRHPPSSPICYRPSFPLPLLFSIVATIAASENPHRRQQAKTKNLFAEKEWEGWKGKQQKKVRGEDMKRYGCSVMQKRVTGFVLSTALASWWIVVSPFSKMENERIRRKKCGQDQEKKREKEKRGEDPKYNENLTVKLFLETLRACRGESWRNVSNSNVIRCSLVQNYFVGFIVNFESEKTNLPNILKASIQFRANSINFTCNVFSILFGQLFL